jgi:hypothetical protein
MCPKSDNGFLTQRGNNSSLRWQEVWSERRVQHSTGYPSGHTPFGR